MNDNRQTVDLGRLVHELLGLNANMLATMGTSTNPANDQVVSGLGALMRRSLELTLLLRDRTDLACCLHGAESARLWGFADVASANFATLWVWANVRAYRYVRGTTYAPLFPPQTPSSCHRRPIPASAG